MGKIAKPINVSEVVFAVAVVSGVVEWKCLCWNYGRTLHQPHYRAVRWCWMVWACCHVEKMGKIAGPIYGNRTVRCTF